MCVGARSGSNPGPLGSEPSALTNCASCPLGHKDFFGEQFVNCRPFRSHHEQVRRDFVFFNPPPPFFEGTRAEFDATLDSCGYGRVLLLFRMRVKTDEKIEKAGPF